MQGANIRDNLNEWALGNPTLLATAAIKSAAKVRQHLPTGRADRRPDQAGQDLVLRRDRPLGLDGAAAERVLQPAAGQGEYSWQGHRRSDARRCSTRASRDRRTRTSDTPTSAQPSRPPASTGTGTTPGRITTQVDTEEPHQLSTRDLQKSCRCTTGPFTGANSIESERGWDWYPSGVVQGTWTAPVSSRLLLEAGAVVADGQLGELRGRGRHAERPLDPRDARRTTATARRRC